MKITSKHEHLGKRESKRRRNVYGAGDFNAFAVHGKVSVITVSLNFDNILMDDAM